MQTPILGKDVFKELLEPLSGTDKEISLKNRIHECVRPPQFVNTRQPIRNAKGQIVRAFPQRVNYIGMPLALIIIRACFEHIKPILRAISETLK